MSYIYPMSISVTHRVISNPFNISFVVGSCQFKSLFPHIIIINIKNNNKTPNSAEKRIYEIIPKLTREEINKI